jgi:hypothetical protein
LAIESRNYVRQDATIKKVYGYKKSNLHFEEVDLHVEGILGEPNLFNDNVYHYFVEIEGSNCDLAFEANSPCPNDNGNFS